ncbi:polyamine aminopropyltransferase [Desulfobacterales bacterium HSG17]|nr:polyamine aminopropyltransferase [Desulfobacterales bacterium HSG17]
MKNKAVWFRESTVPGKRYGKIEHAFFIEKTLLQNTSPFQDILVFESDVYGKMLVLDQIVQFSESDEFIYHEMLTHPILLSHAAPKTILIIGGGDGGTLRECLRHDPEEVILVDIDKEVIDISKEYFPDISQGAFDDTRVTIHHENGKDFITGYKDYFDLIIVDCGDPMGPSLVLFESMFYTDVFNALKKDGMAAFQIGSFLDRSFIMETYATLANLFLSVSPFRLTMPSYHCGEYCFMGASKKIDLHRVTERQLTEKFESLQSRHLFRYYSPRIHKAAQTIPAYLNPI